MPPLRRVRGLTIEFPHERGWRRVREGLGLEGESTEIVPAIANLLGFEDAMPGGFGVKPFTACELQAAFV